MAYCCILDLLITLARYSWFLLSSLLLIFLSFFLNPPPRVSPTNAHFLIGNMFSSPAHLPSKRGELRILMNLRSKSDSVRQLSSSCWPTFRHRTARLGGTFFLCWICYLRNRLDVSIKRYEKPTGAQLLRIVARLGASTYTPKWFGLAVLIRTSTSNFER